MTRSDPFAPLSFHRDEGAENAMVAAALGMEVAAFGPRQERPFSIRAEDGAGALAGGINGVTHWRWLYVRHLFVAEPWRGRGLGRRLLQEAEVLARARGCLGAYLDTFDLGAAVFYERLGYQAFGALEDFPPGHRRTFLAKRLAWMEDN